MEGTIKWFNIKKGYGFILASGRTDDIFFHVTNYMSREEILPGDKVEFDIGIGKNGKEAAINVFFMERGKPIEKGKPYYGKPTFEPPSSAAMLGVTAIGAIAGAAILGPVGAILGGAFFLGSGDWNPKEITSTCLRCGGTGRVTIITPEYIGFQCEDCKGFWKQRNHSKLSMSKVIRKP